MIAADILLDGLFAAVAAIGFGAISDPPMRAFPRIALLAAAGHALRYSSDELRRCRHRLGLALRPPCSSDSEASGSDAASAAR